MKQLTWVSTIAELLFLGETINLALELVNKMSVNVSILEGLIELINVSQTILIGLWILKSVGN